MSCTLRSPCRECAGQPPQNIAAPASLGQAEEQEERLRRRQRLFSTIEDDFARVSGTFPTLKNPEDRGSRPAKRRPRLTKLSSTRRGFDLPESPLRKVFDIRTEDKKTIDMYGGEKNGFGMGCLLARKLVEKGVTCVEVDLGGWDNHAGVFNAIRTGNGPRLDKGMGGLVKDLVDRGMWKNTVVLWMGEFGRTPRINQNNGRDHWARCWSVALGGGAIKGGQVYGSTTKDGMDIQDNKATLGDLFATVYKGMGLDPGAQVRDNLGRPLAIAEGKPLKGLV